MSGEFTPEELAEFTEMRRRKRLALVGLVSVYANITPESDDAEVDELVRGFGPDLTRPVLGMGPGALHHASLDIIMHLLGKLAAARGETMGEAWRREALELTRHADN